MSMLTKPATRKIIDDFAKEIKDRMVATGPKPKKTVIYFRNERQNGPERAIVLVPIELLRYRKDNGRIASDVINYEKNQGRLLETDETAQKIIRQFLEIKDKEKTEELKKSILHEGQRDPAIITCDGFLINGNRRKMVLETLLKEFPGDQRFSTMKVVILPGKNDEGGPPTLKEIEQIENRYQLQSDGKAEYYAFDRALSMRRKIDLGMSLEEQLRDDPVYVGLSAKEFNKAVRTFQEDYLKPLECIDKYLEKLGRDQLYGNVSTKLGDPEGRWQAFYDYYKYVYKKLSDHRELNKLGLEEDEVGKVEDVAHKIIRKREFPNTKAHKIMRDLPKLLSNKEAKKELFRIVDIPHDVEKKEEASSGDGRDLDKRWGHEHGSLIINQVKKAVNLYDKDKEKETPLDLLRAALQKLSHENMNTEVIKVFNVEEAMKLARQIEDRASELWSEFDNHRQKPNKLKKLHSSPK